MLALRAAPHLDDLSTSRQGIFDQELSSSQGRAPALPLRAVGGFCFSAAALLCSLYHPAPWRVHASQCAEVS
jgi:hypothetical protein